MSDDPGRFYGLTVRGEPVEARNGAGVMGAQQAFAADLPRYDEDGVPPAHARLRELEAAAEAKALELSGETFQVEAAVVDAPHGRRGWMVEVVVRRPVVN